MGKYLRISSYTVLGSPSSFMTLQLLHSEFLILYMRENFLFFFISVLRVHFIERPRKPEVRRLNHRNYSLYLSGKFPLLSQG
jgi:hypothetical protein